MAPLVKVLYFGPALEISGKAEEEFGAGDTSSLRKEIFEKYPAMRALTFRMALNRNMLSGEVELADNDIIAILPPFQGG